MLKFAPMQLLWEHREGQQAGSTLYHYFDGTIGHYMAFNLAGEMVFHRMLNQVEASHAEVVQQEIGASRLLHLSMQTPFKAVPPAFKNSPIPELSQNTVCVDMNQDLCMCFNSGDPVSFALPFYLMSYHRHKLFDNYALTLVHGGKAMVAVYAGEQMLLLNAFSKANEAEVLYFTVAALKKAGIGVQSARVELLAEEHESHVLLELFRRFLNNAAYCPANLPYSLDQFPPQAHIAAIMHLMPQCALPEEI